MSDLTVLEGVYEDTDKHIFTFVKTDQPGIQFMHNWDNMGFRLSESGSVKIEQIRVPWTDALGWDAQKKQPIDGVLNIPFATLLLPTIQLVFSNMYVGIALGALEAAQKYTREFTRAWPYGGDDKSSALDEWYILERYGGFRAHLDAAVALADRVGSQIAEVYRDASSKPTNGSLKNGASTNGQHHDESGRQTISARRRGEVAAAVATVKVVTTDTGLNVTSGVFETLGARATAKKHAFDRFWRDIRTHSLHDPVAYKRREVGRYTLVDEIPVPTWYT